MKHIVIRRIHSRTVTNSSSPFKKKFHFQWLSRPWEIEERSRTYGNLHCSCNILCYCYHNRTRG